MRHLAIVRRLAKLGNPHAGPGLVVVLGLLAGIAGCTRTYFRKAADNEVEGILAEKDTEPLWKIEQFHVYPDARARFADPSNPDHPPMPPDDYAAFARSPHPQQPGKAGVGYVRGTAWLDMIRVWDADNRQRREAADGASSAEEGGEKASSNVTAAKTARRPIATFLDEPLKAREPGFLLNLDQSIELGVLNSPQYQTFREQLYEAALPVTQQRFNFAFQWAASEDFIREWAGRQASGSSSSSTVGRVSSGSSSSSGTSTTSANSTSANSTPSNSNPATSTTGGTGSAATSSTSTTPTVTTGPGTNNWTGISTVSFSKLFSTGALLTFDFVNTNVWNFLGQSPFTSTSTINLNLTQPFLQGGGTQRLQSRGLTGSY